MISARTTRGPVITTLCAACAVAAVLAGCGSASLRRDAGSGGGGGTDAGAGGSTGTTDGGDHGDAMTGDHSTAMPDSGLTPRLLEGSMSSLGGIASGGTTRIYDDGFESDERLCAGAVCVRGAITP